jgi:hypothetical protein
LGASWAADSPTLFSTASGVSGLAAGPSAGLRPADYRVRPLCPLRSNGCATGRRTRCRHTGLCKWASTPLLPRSATAFDGALARGDGSDLLTLRLHSHDQSAELAKASPTLWKGFPHCRADPPRHRRSLCHAIKRGFWPRSFDLVGESSTSCWYAVTAFYPLGNRDSRHLETGWRYLTRLNVVSDHVSPLNS